MSKLTNKWLFRLLLVFGIVCLYASKWAMAELQSANHGPILTPFLRAHGRLASALIPLELAVLGSVLLFFSFLLFLVSAIQSRPGASHKAQKSEAAAFSDKDSWPPAPTDRDRFTSE